MPFHSRDRQALIEQFAMPPRRRPGDIRGGQQRFIQDAGGGGGAGGAVPSGTAGAGGSGGRGEVRIFSW